MNDLRTILSTLTAEKAELNYFDLSTQFAGQTGWSPSYFIKADNEDFANGHIAVEHGLENTAILTFLNKPYDFLTFEERKKLLNLSYNNLVDWHIPIDQSRITFVYNRADLNKSVVDAQRIDVDNFSNLRIEAFEKIIGKKPSSNTPALDISLADTISKWKRRITVDLFGKVTNEELSSLFNSIIFLRAIEDNLKRHKKLSIEKVLINEFKNYKNNFSFKELFENTLKNLNVVDVPSYLIDTTKLSVFNKLHKQDIFNLIQDFYVNNINTLFDYDFSIISQHALSRIYEKYVAILKVVDNAQGNLFGINSPEEKINKSSGTYYTPQYIARFFAKLVSKEFSISKLEDLSVLEPSVGSGIFLRSLLELQIERLGQNPSKSTLDNLYKNIVGIDIDENACHATKLSLALLYLVFTDAFPDHIKIINADSIEELSKNVHNSAYDVILSNPPFIKAEKRNEIAKDRIIKHMGANATGKIDEYLLFIDKAISALKPGGMGLFVLPHSFLINNSSKNIRKIISETSLIKYVVDLSSIAVFENTGVYVSLLVFQKKYEGLNEENAVVVKCRNSVGKALDDVIKGNNNDDPNYSIYEIEQNYFKNDYWFILGKQEISIKNKLDAFPKIDHFLEVKQGFVSGMDDVFIVNQPPLGEVAAYNLYIPDKEIFQFNFDKSKLKYVFYPYLNNKKLSETDVQNLYPLTWQYLISKRNKLKSRSLSKTQKWWQPSNPRLPENILKPKIITPHLVFVPKFSIDLEGKITTSHSPYFHLKDEIDSELLYYFLGILNSTPCFWYISTHSHKYGGSYNRLEVATLKATPVPDPSLIDPIILIKFVNLVKQRLSLQISDLKVFDIEKKIDKLACEFYGLSEEEINVFFGTL